EAAWKSVALRHDQGNILGLRRHGQVQETQHRKNHAEDDDKEHHCRRRQGGAGLVPAQVLENEQEKLHRDCASVTLASGDGGADSSGWPLWRWTSRSARCAARGSCVTRMIVFCSERCSSLSRLRISSAERASRSPVGSSATINVGSVTTAR